MWIKKTSTDGNVNVTFKESAVEFINYIAVHLQLRYNIIKTMHKHSPIYIINLVWSKFLKMLQFRPRKGRCFMFAAIQAVVNKAS